MWQKTRDGGSKTKGAIDCVDDVGVKTGTGDMKVDFKFQNKRLKEKGSVRKLTNEARMLINQYL